MSASIIIACKTIDSDIDKCIAECLKLDYSNYEIIVLPDYDEKVAYSGILVVPTGPVKPSVKRNLGMEKASRRWALGSRPATSLIGFPAACR